MSLVHREKSGHSVGQPLHKGRYFTHQQEVDQLLQIQDEKEDPQVSFFVMKISFPLGSNQLI